MAKQFIDNMVSGEYPIDRLYYDGERDVIFRAISKDKNEDSMTEIGMTDSEVVEWLKQSSREIMNIKSLDELEDDNIDEEDDESDMTVEEEEIDYDKYDEDQDEWIEDEEPIEKKAIVEGDKTVVPDKPFVYEYVLETSIGKVKSTNEYDVFDVCDCSHKEKDHLGGNCYKCPCSKYEDARVVRDQLTGKRKE